MPSETLISIAERVGVSVSTVSRVLSGKADKYRISSRTVGIVKAEAEKCGYQPNYVAQSLRTHKTHSIGLVIPSIENPFFANIACNIVTNARKSGYNVVIADAMDDFREEKENVFALLARNVDGIILCPSGEDPSYLEKINDHKIPVVLIDRYFLNSNIPFVATDNYSGAYDATKLLLSEGHSRITCIQGSGHTSPAIERNKGYRDAMSEAGYEHMIQIVGNGFSVETGYVETKMILNAPQRPTAIFAMSNLILLGVIKAINESGLRIPDDISVITFDDQIYLDFLSPAITSIKQPLEDIGLLAVKILLQEIDGNSRAENKIKLPPSIQIRKSIKRIN